MSSDETPPAHADFVEKIRAEGMSDVVVRSFLHHLAALAGGPPPSLPGNAIEGLDSLPDSSTFDDHTALGLDSFHRVAVIKLNGGLGTSMGLDRAKSLLEVRRGLTFLDLIARQAISLREAAGAQVPLLLMNSYRTESDAAESLDRYPDLEIPGLPLGFNQHKVPKVLADGFGPASWPRNPELEWCPPGHGDVYTALMTTGLIHTLCDRGVEYAFISNADNLGAVLDPALFGFMIDRGAPFMLEAADRTAADRKGGHLCRLADGRPALRESAQCPPGEEAEFQDIDRYRFFNTNNVWVHLPSLAALFEEHGGILPLSTIANRKTLDPADPTSPAVVQLETAMGDALSLIPGAVAVRVPRSRFSPVKTTDDLLAVRSDAFDLSTDWRITLNRRRQKPPTVTLNKAHYGFINDFDQRFPKGPPSLLHCDSLTIHGDVTFGEGVEVVGDVHLDGSLDRIPDGTTLGGSSKF